VSRLDAGVQDFESAAWGNYASLYPEDAAAIANAPVNLDFQRGSTTKAETGILPGGTNPLTIAGRSNVFFSGGGITSAYIFHEALHSVTGFGDRNLALKLGLSPLGNPSVNIQNALKAHGCV
jgi:hypothetical protein